MAYQQFVPCEGIYLLNHSVGRMPRRTRAHVERQFFDAWEHGDPEPWPRWLDAVAEFREALGAVFNRPAHEFCPQVNISGALSKLLPALPSRGVRRTLVFSENDFPSVGFVLQQAVGLGYHLKIIPASADLQDLGTWRRELTPDVHSVLVTHVYFNTGRQIPVAEVGELASERGILSVVDIAQSAGVVPIDLGQWCADVVLGSCVKWLCGGPGAGFMWLQPELVSQLKPRDVGWFSHEDPFEFDINSFDYAGDARRFWGGTPSVLPYATASASLALIHEIGVDNIARHNRELTQKIIDAVDPSCLQAPVEPALRGGTLVLKFPEQEKVEARLREAGVRFDSRSFGLRLSPHIYNTCEEVAVVVDCLKSA